MATTSTFYTALGRAALTDYNFPAGYYSGFTQSLSGNAGSSALAIDTNAQPGQKAIIAASTTIAAGSNGASLPQSTINVVSTVGFATSQSGTILVTTGAGAQTVTYTGTTSTTFTGCSGGTGAMSTGGAVTTTNGGFSATTNSTTQTFGLVQMISPPLGVNVISTSVSWTIQFAAKVSNAVSGFTWGGIAGLYLIDYTNHTVKTTLVAANSAVGTASRTTATELTCRLSSVPTVGFTSAAGDYFVLELGVAMTTGVAGSAIPNITIYGDGITPIGSDAAAATDAQSTFTTPSAVVYSPSAVRSQIAASPVIQPRNQTSRAQISNAPVLQPRFQTLRAQFSTSPVIQPRTGDPNLYRMRGRDATLARIVYWVSSIVDSTGQQYSGPGNYNAGTLTDIVVASVLEA